MMDRKRLAPSRDYQFWITGQQKEKRGCYEQDYVFVIRSFFFLLGISLWKITFLDEIKLENLDKDSWEIDFFNVKTNVLHLNYT